MIGRGSVLFGRRISALSCAFVALFVSAVFLSGCGGSSKPPSVAVTASAATVDGTDTVTLTATVTNDKATDGVSWSVSGGGTLSNTTTTSATYTAPAATASAQTVTVTATSVADATKTGTATITVPAQLTITTTAAQLAGTVGTVYSVQLNTSTGISPYKWTLDSTSAALPTGWSLTSGGLLTGPAPMASLAGTIDLVFDVTDSGTPTPMTASESLNLIITPAPAISFTGTMPTTATDNVAYAGSSAATGGAGTLTYSMAAGSGPLPTGLVLNPSTGAITGKPTAVGAFPFAIEAADAFGDAGAKDYTITVSYPALVVTPATLPVGYVGSTYTTTNLAATGGSGSGYSFALASGSSLPAGLTLSTGGAISGKPTGTPGTANFTVTVTDSASDTANGSFSITIDAELTVTPSTPPVGYVGSQYTQTTLAATGGSGTGYNWALASGSSLPAGLTLSTGGVISGKPTGTPGPTNFTATVTDSAGNTASGAFTITIDAGISFTPVPLPTGYQGTAYPATTLLATGGSGTGYTWVWVAASGSSLPSGLTLSTGGVITGTPTAGGTFSVTITVTDSAGNTASTTPTLSVEAKLAITTATPLGSGSVGVAYTTTLTATGGTGTYSWSVPLAADVTCLAARGLSLSTTGVLSSGGANLTAGEEGSCTNFGVQVSDNATPAHTASSTFTVSVNALGIIPTTLGPAITGSIYGQTLTATGGNAPYTWTVSVNSSGLTAIGLSVVSSSSTTATLSGTVPSSATPGPVTFTVKATDSTSASTTQQYTINVYTPVSLPAANPASLPSTGTTGVAYSGTISASGGSGNYSWTVTFTGTNDNLTVTTPSTGPTISGTPGRVELNPPITFVVKVTDTTTTLSATQTYTISVNEPNPPSLPTPSASVPGPATTNVSYSGVIAVSGGTGPYTWTVNGATPPLTLPGGDDLTVSTNAGGSQLLIDGLPTTAETATLTNVVVTDNLGGTASNTYTIAVNAPGAQVSGQINLNTSCGGGGASVPAITVSINTSPVQTTTTDTGGNYSFAGIPAGAYTITPSITGTGLVSMFYPATQNVTLSGSNVTENFSVSLGYTVSGTVTYTAGGTAQTGQTYLTLNGNSCGGGGLGTGITNTVLTAGGAFTIRGVPPGSYTLQAWMDPLGQGVQNAIDPTGNSTVTVTDASVTTAAVTMTNPTFATPTENPTISGIIPNAQGVLIEFSPSKNSNGVEDANQYLVQWSTSPTLGGGTGGGQFATISGSHTFTANGDNGVWVLTNRAGWSGHFRQQPNVLLPGPVLQHAGYGRSASDGVVRLRLIELHRVQPDGQLFGRDHRHACLHRDLLHRGFKLGDHSGQHHHQGERAVVSGPAPVRERKRR